MLTRRKTLVMAAVAIWGVAWAVWTADGWPQFDAAPVERVARRLLLCTAGASMCLALAPLLARAGRRSQRRVLAVGSLLALGCSVAFALLSELIFYVVVPRWGPSNPHHIPSVALMALWVFLAWILLFVAMETDAERRARALDALDARHRLLLSQAQPHFLFNALNTVYALVIARDRQAGPAIVSLSDYLRLSLDADTAGLIPLSEEIAATLGYAAIEQLRFGDRMKLDVTVEPSARSVQVPGMIIQPLIENCIKHAVSATSEPISIGLSVSVRDRRCIIRVEDDGPGGANRGPGIGLTCVAGRLRAAFHDAASVVGVAGETGGYTAELQVPA